MERCDSKFPLPRVWCGTRLACRSFVFSRFIASVRGALPLDESAVEEVGLEVLSHTVHRKSCDGVVFFEVLESRSGAQRPDSSIWDLLFYHVFLQLHCPLRYFFLVQSLPHEGCVRAFSPLWPFSERDDCLFTLCVVRELCCPRIWPRRMRLLQFTVCLSVSV